MKASTAEREHWHCPKCRDETTLDPSGKGWVRHKTDPNCQHGQGEKDEPYQDGGGRTR
jgi:hypothetical protein